MANMTHLDPPYGNEALEDEGSGLNTGETESGHAVIRGGTRATVMITEMHGNISKGYHGLLIYNGRDFDTKMEEEPLLSWVVMTTQLTEDGGEYTVLIDYEDKSNQIKRRHHGRPHIGEQNGKCGSDDKHSEWNI